MYAIVEIAGQQFKVAKDQKVFVHRLASEEGDKVSFDNVLLLDNDGDVTIGAPAIDGAAVEAKVVKHLKGDKVIVFKKKRRKGYRVKNGHRQSLTEIVIEDIVAKGATKKAAPKKKAEPKAKEEAKPAAKKATTKKSTSKKGDDLKKIEGIGPKAAEALTNAGVDTYAKLAKKSADEVKEILTEASSTLAHLDPGTWADQAQLAADGKWDELQKWQDELNGGK
ncbi:50S ribosomal protein L21 [Galbibacter mesophilus]|uniref:50S ribosomal protein L21 n=1 Tax=Galbibacter mesophilus TaxID=379069 RepID=UPI00191CC39C|nr:50S ribosomal protein L21 [Galbibacter mesophilus]MCM5661890.1 50S ribosomal protein L21 [Galbibacter mesophilus]